MRRLSCWSICLMMAAILNSPIWAEDVFQGRLQSIESLAASLRNNPREVVVSDSLQCNYSRDLACYDLRVLLEKTKALRLKMESQDDLAGLETEMQALITAMPYVRRSLAGAHFTADGKLLADTLLLQMTEVERITARSRREQQKSQARTRPLRNPYPGEPDWGDPHSGWSPNPTWSVSTERCFTNWGGYR